MADDDVWDAGEVSREPDPTFGEVDYEQAFAVDVVFKYGIAILQEQPAMALLGGLNILALAFLVSGLSFVTNLTLSGMAVAGQLDQQVADILSQLSGLGLQLMAFPFNQLVLAGLMVAAALWIRSEVVSIGALYTSLGAAVRGLMAGLIVGALTVVLVLGLMLPAIGASVYFVQAGDLMTGVGAGVALFLPALPVLIYVGLGLMLAPYAAVLDHLGPLDAIQRSWSLADGLRLTLFVTMFVFGLLGLFSVCLCNLPLIVLMPIQIMGLSAAYLRASRALAETDEWAFFQRNK